MHVLNVIRNGISEPFFFWSLAKQSIGIKVGTLYWNVEEEDKKTELELRK